MMWFYFTDFNSGPTQFNPVPYNCISLVNAQENEEKLGIKMDEKKVQQIIQPSKNQAIAENWEPFLSKQEETSKKDKKCKKRQNYDEIYTNSAEAVKKKICKVAQTPQRNILPNILHQAFCFVQIKKRSGKLVEQYIASKYSVQRVKKMVNRYYIYQNQMRDRASPYVNLKSLQALNVIFEPNCEIFSLEQQLLFLKLTRILIKNFLEKQLDSIILTSIRMKEDSRKWHFQWKRKILDSLKNIFLEA